MTISRTLIAGGCALALLLPASAGAKGRPSADALKETLIAQTTQIWQAFKDKQVDAFTAMLRDDFVNVDWSGVGGKSDIAGAMADYSGVDFKLDNFQLVKADHDAAILTYHVAFHGNYKGKQAGPTSINATDVYVKRGGNWLAVLHQETAAP